MRHGHDKCLFCIPHKTTTTHWIQSFQYLLNIHTGATRTLLLFRRRRSPVDVAAQHRRLRRPLAASTYEPLRRRTTAPYPTAMAAVAAAAAAAVAHAHPRRRSATKRQAVLLQTPGFAPAAPPTLPRTLIPCKCAAKLSWTTALALQLAATRCENGGGVPQRFVGRHAHAQVGA